LDDLEGQYCNRNCIGCNASSLATAGLSCIVSCHSNCSSGCHTSSKNKLYSLLL